MSKKYTLNKKDLIQIAKVLGYTAASAVVSGAIVILQDTEVPVEYAMYAMILNILLVTVKKYLSGTK